MVSQLTKKRVQSPYHCLQGSNGVCTPLGSVALPPVAQSFHCMGLLAVLRMHQTPQHVIAIFSVNKVLLRRLA